MIKYGLTRAVLEGRKTQTRRIPTDSVFQRCRSLAFCEEGFTPYWDKRFAELLFLNAQYCVGEEVAIAQSYKDTGVSTETVTHNGVTETFYQGFEQECKQNYAPQIESYNAMDDRAREFCDAVEQVLIKKVV